MDSLQNLADVLASQARSASGNLRTLSENSRKAVLLRTAELLREKKSEIFEKNRLDLENNKGKISDAMLDRLTLNEARLEAMARGVEEIAEFPTPIGKVLEKRTLANGIDISRVAVPIGSVFFIYESFLSITDATFFAIDSISSISIPSVITLIKGSVPEGLTTILPVFERTVFASSIACFISLSV